MNSSLLRRLAAMRLEPDQMSELLTMFADQEEAEERRKAAQRERAAKSRRKRDGNVTVTSQTDYGNVTLPSEGSPPAPPSPNHPTIPPSPPKGGSSPAGFDAFWAGYPNKVGKAIAAKAFQQASQRAPIETIMAGLARYVAKTDDRPWCNPATWLNQDRWEDQPASVAPLTRGQPPPRRTNPVSDAWGLLERHDNGPIDITPDAGSVRYLPAGTG